MDSLFLYFFVLKLDILASLKSKIAQILAISKALASGQFIIADNHCGFCLHPEPYGFLVMESGFPFVLSDCIHSLIPIIPAHLWGVRQFRDLGSSAGEGSIHITMKVGADCKLTQC